MKIPVKVRKFGRECGQIEEEVEIAREAPLTIYLNDREMATLLASPEAWDELAMGFLLSEGLLLSEKDGLEIQLDYQRGLAWVTSPHVDKIVMQTWQKRFITSGCGSGSKNFYSLAASRQLRPLDDAVCIQAERLVKLMREMQKASSIYTATHGVHGAALATPEQLEVFREDVGRHNALDKIRGHCFLNDIPSAGKILISTGRISSEMLLKAAGLKTPIVVSRSAPTDLSTEHARNLNITLVGMVRGQKLFVYTGEERILS